MADVRPEEVASSPAGDDPVVVLDEEDENVEQNEQNEEEVRFVCPIPGGLPRSKP